MDKKILGLGLLLMFFLSSLIMAEPLTFAPPEWNLGDVAIGETYSIEVRAKGLEPREITNVRPACECLSVKVVRGEIRDESEGVISATLHIDNTLSVFFRVFFYVHTNDLKNPFYKYYITGRVKGKGLSNSEIVIFMTPACAGPVTADRPMAKDYQEIQKRLEEISVKNPSLIIKEYLAQDIDSTRLRSQFEKQYSLNRYAEVEMFSGNGSFIGKDEIIKEITRVSNTKSSTTGLNGLTGLQLNQPVPGSRPEDPSGAVGLNPVVKVLFFYTVGCPGCREIREELFPSLRKKFTSQIAIIEYDIAEIENYKKLMAIEETLHIRSNAPVSLFIGQKALLGSKEILGKTETVIAQAIMNPLTPASPARGEVKVGADKIQERFMSFSVLAVIGAGLLDGINPCAFATIIFLISFLAFIGKTRKEIIIVGVFYTLAVFMTYLLLGIGVFKAFQTLSAYGIIARIILYLTAALVFCLGALSLYDLINYLRTKKTSGITLQLPLSLKQRIHSIIRTNINPGRLIIGALVIGFLVTLFEAVCTGQVYLPTIVFILRTVGSAQVLRDAQLKASAFWYLVLYNLMFTLPLVVVFILAYYGLGSKRLTTIAERNLVLSKVLLSAFFIGLGILLLIV